MSQNYEGKVIRANIWDILQGYVMNGRFFVCLAAHECLQTWLNGKRFVSETLVYVTFY